MEGEVDWQLVVKRREFQGQGRRASMMSTRGWLGPVLAGQVDVKLPNGINAVVDVMKLRDYCLNPGHPEGRHKARVFRATLGMEREDVEELRAALLAAVRDQDAVAAEADEYGERYVLDLSCGMKGARRGLDRHGSSGMVRISCQ